MKNLTKDEMVQALHLAIGESAGPERAAVNLLASFPVWLERLDSVGAIDIIDDPETHEVGARIQWPRVGQMAWPGASSSEVAVLRVAASLASGAHIDLGAELARMSGRTAADVVDAVVAATRSGDTVLVTRSPGVAR